jgi:hypothetical protein
MYLLILIISLLEVHAQTCSSETGVDLRRPNQPYSRINPRNQGALGNCFAYSASDLVSTFYKKDERLNVFDIALNDGSNVEGGQPASAINSLAERGWGCTDESVFWNLFPSKDVHFINDIYKALIPDFPVFFTNTPHSVSGRKRQADIATMAIRVSRKEVGGCDLICGMESGLQEFLKLQAQTNEISNSIKRLEREKNLYGTDWLYGMLGKKTNEDYDREINELKQRRERIIPIRQREHARYIDNNSILMQGRSQLDELSVRQAAEVVLYWARKSYPKVKEAYQKYGIGQYAPTIEEFIEQWSYYDSEKKSYAYAGGNYPYAILKDIVEKACPENKRIRLTPRIEAKSMRKNEGEEKMEKQIEKMLTQANPQGAGLSFKTDLISSTSTDSFHAVNIIGCRTLSNGKKEYLLHNSWGSSCQSYLPELRTPDKCQFGRVWVESSKVLRKATEIQWIQRR